MGLNTDALLPLFPSTVYHYLLTVEVADPAGVGGSAHGRLQVSFITEDGEIKDFNLSEE